MNRPVDRAMTEERPEKTTVREIWLETITRHDANANDDAVPLYATLCGASALDIQALIHRGIIRTTEVGGIDSRDAGKVVAIENNSESVLKLVGQYPGLSIREVSVKDMLHGPKATVWPQGKNRRDCRARVVNLDLNEPIIPIDEQGQLTWPLIQLITKLAVLHEEPPAVPWSLLLTLHGEILWDARGWAHAQHFLVENCRQDNQFADAMMNILGQDTYDQIVNETPFEGNGLPRLSQQKVLMAFVPKKIIDAMRGRGWIVRTRRNLAYGGENYRAPMVTWVFDFDWDEQATAAPNDAYRIALREVLTCANLIDHLGELAPVN